MGVKHGARWALSWFSSTILDDIQFQVLFFAGFATMVCCVSELTDRNLGIQPIMITVTGVVVSLVVSFKTNSAYARWWEGRNLWASLTTSSRQLAMLLWFHVPNVKAEAKDDKKDDKDKDEKKKHKRSKRKHRKDSAGSVGSAYSKEDRGNSKADRSLETQIGALRYESSEDPHETLLPSPTSGSALVSQQPQPATTSLRTRIAEHPETDLEAGGETSEDDGPFSRGRHRRRSSGTKSKPYALEPLRDSPIGSRSASRVTKDGVMPDTGRTKGSAYSRKSTASTTMSKLIRKETDKDEETMRKSLEGMLEKKTYIGLVQAFGVSMKHALRGESGPFYSDLYDLIAFLPKYNTSVMPPVQREDLLVPWVNGIPRQKALYDDDSIAVPLTVPAPFTGYAFDTEHLTRTATKAGGDSNKDKEKGLAVKFAPAPPASPNKASYPPMARTASRASAKGDSKDTKTRDRRPSFVNVPASGPTTSSVPGADTAYPNAAASGTSAGKAPSTDISSPIPRSSDPEKTASPNGWSTTSPAFRSQAITSATSYLRSGAESHHHAFARLDKHHRVLRKSEDVRNGKAHITSVELMPPRHPPTAQWWDFFPPARLVKIVVDWVRNRERVLQQERVRGGRRKRGGGMRSEIPQEVLMYLTAYVNTLIQTGRLNTTIVSPIMTSLFELQKCLTDLDKIASTPIPSAYSFHLRLTVWAYLLFLPFQVYPLLGWNTIPAVAIAAITYLGFLEIGCQIEMPFGYDHSDLDLDRFTLKIARQLAEVTAFPTSLPPNKIMLSNLNRPLLPTLSHSVPELLGVKEAKPRSTPLGFEASYRSDSESEDEKKGKKDKSRSKKTTESSSESDSDSEEAGSSGGSSSTTASSETSASDSDAEKRDKTPKKPLPKTVRDVERALVANWHNVSGETEAFIGKPRHQLENRTGMEVAVMTL